MGIFNTPFINKYKGGRVTIHNIVESNTQVEAKSLSFPNLTAIITPLVALGIANKKNTVYLIVEAIGK